MDKRKLIVIGGGAAGFFCAISAATSNSSLDVMIIEKTGKLLSKVKVSGGGRCNVTHSSDDVAELVKNYPRGGNFLKRCFHRFFVTDTVLWFRQRGVELKAEVDGRMFPISNSSQTIIDCLLTETAGSGIGITLNREVKQLTNDQGKWVLALANEEQLSSDFVCVACGGYAKASQFGWLKMLGHSIEEPVPSLFTFKITDHPIKELMGISVEDVLVKITGTKFFQQGPLLITHWGFSGPAVLKLSAFGARELFELRYIFSIMINWLPQYNEQTLREKFLSLRKELAAQKIANRNPFHFPQRLWDYFIKQAGINANIRWADLPAKQQNILVKNLCSQIFKVNGKTTFKEEFVTAGGINLEEVDVNSMQSKAAPGLFFAGEIMNVDGITGGFNFQHAWTSGWIAGQAIAAIANNAGKIESGENN